MLGVPPLRAIHVRSADRDERARGTVVIIRPEPRMVEDKVTQSVGHHPIGLAVAAEMSAARMSS